ncbi:unnamed protein product [Miscanthus lutarioriparius]|uniref:Uncharacterized protein n=1 Tax=Miscanthus lutarioriparius TaxID=422564 RepID=A0A811SCS9_9POAL|nr:unnamed protein product [Miscanthus lutarioriparius]
MANHQQRISPSPRNPPLHASSLPATPSVQGLYVHQYGGSQEIHQEPGTSKNRAKWDHQKRLYLIKLLKIHDVLRFRTHSAWSKEAWTGRYAEGRSCRGMDHYANKAISPSQVSPDVHLQSPSASIPAPGSFSFDIEEDRDDINWFETLRHSARPSSSTPEAVDGKRDKRQKTKHTITTEHFHEKYLKLKKEEIERFAAIEEKKLDDPFSINKCITVLEGLSELQTGDMLKATDIFKDNPSNREVFLSFGSDALRVGWLLRQI